jgi:UDP-N-acetylmuramate--alanine ligase
MQNIYFIGAGGIGMSALVRYFLSKGYFVAGYDRTPCALTEKLIEEGAQIHYDDDVALIPAPCKDKENTLVVVTPAIPSTHSELNFFKDHGFELKKRAEVLGMLTREMKGLCCAGTHGKTTTSSMTAHLLHESAVGCNAFLGGITKNYGTNYLLNTHSPYVVIEADEFDRSFHHLRPYATLITSADPDHLDIYGTEEAYLESFSHYTSLIQPGGALVVHRGLKFEERQPEGVKRYDYSRHEGDFHAENIRIGNGKIVFDLVSPIEPIVDVELGVPVSINIDNGIGAMALAQIAGLTADEIKRAMKTFGGVDRRFDFYLNDERHVLLSDYAHHPEEIKQSILSLREVFAGRKISGVFQPHLYSRTRDFYREFADALSLLDEVYVTEIYPARELPIEGVTSELIGNYLRADMAKTMCLKTDLPQIVKTHDFDVLVVLGAGDVENYMAEFKNLLEAKQ